MEDPLQHPAIKWILTIIVFVASFHATWTALKYINRVPKPAPDVEYEMREPQVPPQHSPGVLVRYREWPTR
jgi:hypothetical protein